MSFKERQSNYVAVFPEGGELEILAMDRDQDVALLGKTFDDDPLPRPRSSCIRRERQRSSSGDVRLPLGYPTGHKMVTKAIVSSPNKDRKGSFLLDAVLTPGFSGGLPLPSGRSAELRARRPRAAGLGRTTYGLAPPRRKGLQNTIPEHPMPVTCTSRSGRR